MKLITFSVTNYRSITKAHRISLEDITILLGKNNEGKSNILKAISVAMSMIENRHSYERDFIRELYIRDSRAPYIWKRDFPVIYQNRKQGLYTIFKMEFELDENEIEEFKKNVQSSINGTVQIQIKVGNDNIPKIEVLKRGTKSYKKKADSIINFISKKMSFNYIPAIRTEEEGIYIIRDNLSKELSVIEDNDKYKEAINEINNLQRVILDDIAQKIKKSLTGFIPTIKDVKLNIIEDSRIRALRRDVEVIIDDGTPTKIEYKGDGIKSLVSLGLLTDRYNSHNSSMIAIDEPEAHLHPGAIRELNNVIRNLKKDNQVIIATHNPLFVDIGNIKNNIIINEGKATQCKNIQEIRDVLGVKTLDNLINSRYVLVVEGENDRIVLSKVLNSKSKVIEESFNNKELTIHVLNGASKLESSLSFMKTQICECYSFLDNDNEGRNAIEKCKSNGLCDEKHYNLAGWRGMNNSELEDLINEDIYVSAIESTFAISIDKRKLHSMNKKWSERMRDIYEENGKIWNDSIEKQFKNTVSKEIGDYDGSIDNIFNTERIFCISTLISNLEKMLKNEL